MNQFFKFRCAPSILLALLLASCSSFTNKALQCSGEGGPNSNSICVTATLMVDFPSSKLGAFREITERKLRLAIELLNSRIDQIGPLLVEAIPAKKGIPKLGDVKDLLNRAIIRHNSSGNTVQFKLLKQSLYGEGQYVAALPPTSKFSCVRWEWIEGQLVTIYNYHVELVNDDYSPSNIAELKDAGPVYSIVARFRLNQN